MEKQNYFLKILTVDDTIHTLEVDNLVDARKKILFSLSEWRESKER